MSTQGMSFLRRVLVIDAGSCGLMGLMLVAFCVPLSSLLNLPADKVKEAGLLLLPCAAFVGYLAAMRSTWRAGVWALIVVNIVWTVESVALLFTDWVSPNTLGTVFIIGQALFTALMAELEYVGLRRIAATAA